jgi:hypothetical protein
MKLKKNAEQANVNMQSQVHTATVAGLHVTCKPLLTSTVYAHTRAASAWGFLRLSTIRP